MVYFIVGFLFSSVTLASQTCIDLQKAEAKILEVTYYGAGEAGQRSFCYFLSRAVSSKQGLKIGLDGLLQGSIEYCVDSSTKVQTSSLSKEIRLAMSEIKNCFSEIGQ